MKTDYSRLSQPQMDALGELANIGAGNSASALAALFGDKVMISVPKIRIVSFKDVREKIAGADSQWIAVNLKILGQIPGGVMLLFPRDQGLELAATLRRETPGNTAELSEVDYATLGQIGTVVGNAYIQAIADMGGLSLTAVLHDVSSGSLTEVWSHYFDSLTGAAARVVFAETEFDGRSTRLRGNLLFTPSGEYLEVLWQAFGVL